VSTAIADQVRRRERSAAEVLEEHLERLTADGLGAVWQITEDRARREAAAVDSAVATGCDPGPLAGVPVGWKDLIDTAGISTTYGSAIFRDHVPDRDADVVARFAAAGAVCVAKLATHEFAWGTTCQNPHFGSCRNPHDPSRVPGGSSGGCGAALAEGMVAAAPGTDTAGSIRCPASCCGVVGLKPTFGRVSMAGIRPLCPTLDHCGPMARTVADCAAQLEVMAGPSPRDPRTPPVPVERWSETTGRGVEGLTVGVAESHFFEHTAPDIAAQVRRGLDTLRDAGATVVEVDMEWPTGLGDPFTAEAAATLWKLWPGRQAEMSADLILSLEHAQGMRAVDVAITSQGRLEYQGRMHEKLLEAGIDLIATPTQGFTPPPIGITEVPFAGRPAVDVAEAMCGLTWIFNLLGWPAISVPCGRDALGLPVGLQLAALPWREDYCLAAATVVEAVAPTPRAATLHASHGAPDSPPLRPAM
jgi:aspartyl-tRNA(Asn)/glutamyl-tRNA(Gln) amidotransferase subunit A